MDSATRSLKRSYTLLAPLYDLFADRPFARARQASVHALSDYGAGCVLLNGVGSGLDLPFLPPLHRYVGLDLTRAMIERCRRRSARLDFSAVRGDALALPFRDGSFDHAVLHLILAVVPDAARALAESARVVKPRGAILVFDKFLQPGQRAGLRRAASGLAGRFVTRLDVVFEEALALAPGLRLVSDEPAAACGWFRRIRLEKS